MCLPFALHQSFLDQQQTKDGQPYGPIRYKEIVKECYLISRNTSTSYSEILNMTPLERHYILEFLIDEDKANKKMIEERTKELQSKRGK